jgi:HD-GYP domain-containing protein (c-di-GMP phosphodiesterase class II)/putative methionine-R-sulfoxide reductase with GAF domain
MRSYKVQFVIAGILSLLAQAGLLISTTLNPYIPLTEWEGTIVGAALFVLAALWIISIIQSAKIGWTLNILLLLTLVLVVVGTFFLVGDPDSRAREIGFLLTSLITTLTIYGMAVNTSAHPSRSRNTETTGSEGRTLKLPELEINVNALKEQIALLTQNLNTEKHRTTQLTYLNELSQQLESDLDPPLAAQLAVNMLEHIIKCSVVSLMLYEPENREFVALASSGRTANIVPPGYRQREDTGALGRAARLKKTLIINDATLDPDFIPVNKEVTLSEIIVPVMEQGQLKGMIEICSEVPQAFSNMDAAIAERVASELARAWGRSSYNQRLTELIQAGISLTTLFDPQAAVQEIAILARKTFQARFVFVTLLDQQGNFSRTASAGDAPRLLNALTHNPSEEPLIRAALNASRPFRVRDLRKFTSEKNLDIDHAGLRSALAIPIRLHRLSIGTIIAFGKQDGIFFTENDESLADLLASQAAASVESSWLYQELRNNYYITSMLRQLSEDVILTEDISRAAEKIAFSAHTAADAKETGIILFTPEGEVQAEVELDANGFHTRRQHPMENIMQAIQAGQSIYISKQQSVLVCYPLLTRTRPVGALWMDIPEGRGQKFTNMQLLANQAAVSLERSNLLSELRKKAEEIEAAYEELEASYDQTLTALMSALDARDRETEGHSTRVSKLACMLGEKMGLNGRQLKALERGAKLHDIGKIGISDTILHKPGKLTDDELRIMRVHPDIGARIVERIPFLQESMPVVRYHHERWDGSGYPLGLTGRNIPIQARIFAVADVFDALTSKRSYRKKSSPGEVLKYLRDHANILFDAEIVEALAQLPYADFTEGEPIS